MQWTSKKREGVRVKRRRPAVTALAATEVGATGGALAEAARLEPEEEST